MTFKTIPRVAPAVEPVTLAEAKEQLKVEHAVDDALISRYIAAARDRVEKFCNRFFTEQQVTLLNDSGFPLSVIELPYPDLASVESVEYTDSDNAIQIVDSGDYAVDLDAQTITTTASWPSDAKDYRVNVTTGEPVEFSGVIIGIHMIIADLYELRTETVVGTIVAVNKAVSANVYPYRVELGVR